MWHKFQGLWPPLGPLKGICLQWGPKGGSDPWILSYPNLRSGPLMLSFEGWAFEFYFCPTWGLVPILFSDVSPLHLGPNYTFDWKGRTNNLDWWNPLQNWHQTVENLSKWPAYLRHAEEKTMAKIQEVHGFIRFTDQKCMSKYSQHANMPKIF